MAGLLGDIYSYGNMLVGYGMFGNKSVLADPKQVQQALAWLGALIVRDKYRCTASSWLSPSTITTLPLRSVFTG